MDIAIGDVVCGRFSGRPQRTETAIVRGIVDGQWHGDCIDYEPRSGYGTWGYASEVDEVLRQATEDDERKALNVQHLVGRDTEQFLAGLR